jgi:hypothetical protein
VKAGKNAKAVVLGLAERDGQIHMHRVNRASLENIWDAVNTRIDPETPKIVTDGNQLYKGAIPRAKHERGNHAEELKDKNWTRTQTVENAFSLFKRGIVGNYHKLSADHLDRYLGEFCWRYSHRKMQPWLFDMALTNMLNKKPLPYKDLTF